MNRATMRELPGGINLATKLMYGFGTVAYVVLIGVSFLNAELALAGHFALAVFYVFDRTSA